MLSRSPSSTTGATALAPGTRLGEYEIERVLEKGGVETLYAAHDHGLQRRVVLREYLPAILATRGPGGEVLARPGLPGEMFALGLRAFAHEARLLARCDHPALGKVLRYWEASHTGYMVMRSDEGETLQAWRDSLQQPPGEKMLRTLLVDLLGALEALHAVFAQHRDIEPGNILLPPEGRPVLLGFHAAGRLLAERGVLPGAREVSPYAPLEAHPEGSHLQQGPWSDLYSLAAVAYFCVSGEPPPPATVRTGGGVSRPLSAAAREAGSRHAGLQYSPAFLTALDWGFELQPQARPRSAAEWRAVLLQTGTTSRPPGTAGLDAVRRPGVEADRAMGAAVLHRRLPDPEGAPPGDLARGPERGAAVKTEPTAEPTAEAVRVAVAAALDSLPPRRDAPDFAMRRPAETVSSTGALQRRWLWPVVGVLGLMAAAAGWQWSEQQRDARRLMQALAGTAGPPKALVASPGASQPLPDSGLVAAAEEGREEAAIRPAPPPAVAASALGPGEEARDSQGEAPASTLPHAVTESQPFPGAPAPVQPPASSVLASVAPRIAPVNPAPVAPPPAATAKGEKPAPSRGTSSPMAVRSVSKAPAPVQFKSPREACAPRQRFSLYYCMQQQCEKPQFRSHRQCVALRERDEIE